MGESTKTQQKLSVLQAAGYKSEVDADGVIWTATGREQEAVYYWVHG